MPSLGIHCFTNWLLPLSFFLSPSLILYYTNLCIFQLIHSLKTHVHEMYANIALLVKWADFASRDPRYSMNREYIFYCVTRFKDALNVSLFQNVLSLSHSLSLSLKHTHTHSHTHTHTH